MGQVEDNELGDACICHSIDDSEWISRPCISGSCGGFSDEGEAVFEIEAEEEFLGAKLSNPVREFAGIGEGLEGENDAGGTATEKPAGLFEIADAHVDVELESIGDEPTECLPMGDFAHESVEVGDVESFESEIVPDGAGDIERAGGIGELGDDGLVFIASPADAANDVAVHEIEDGNDFHNGAYEGRESLLCKLELAMVDLDSALGLEFVEVGEGFSHAEHEVDGVHGPEEGAGHVVDGGGAISFQDIEDVRFPFIVMFCDFTGAVRQGAEGRPMSRAGKSALRTEGDDLLESIEIFLE